MSSTLVSKPHGSPYLAQSYIRIHQKSIFFIIDYGGVFLLPLVESVSDHLIHVRVMGTRIWKSGLGLWQDAKGRTYKSCRLG